MKLPYERPAAPRVTTPNPHGGHVRPDWRMAPPPPKPAWQMPAPEKMVQRPYTGGDPNFGPVTPKPVFGGPAVPNYGAEPLPSAPVPGGDRAPSAPNTFQGTPGAGGPGYGPIDSGYSPQQGPIPGGKSDANPRLPTDGFDAGELGVPYYKNFSS